MDKPAPAKHSLQGLLSGVFIIILASSTAFLVLRVMELQRNTASLTAESQKLSENLKALEEEKTSMNEKFTLAEKERDEFKALLEGMKSETTTLHQQLNDINGSLGSTKEETTYLEEMLINKNKEIEQLKDQIASASSQAAPIPSILQTTPTPVVASGDLSGQLAQKEEEIRKLREYNNVLTQKLERIYKTTNEKISEINVAKITLEETITQARKIIDSEWNTVDLGQIAVETPSTGKASTSPKRETRRQPKTEGRVLAVNEEHGFVVVDLGKMDNLSDNSVLSLKKNGRDVAKLSVLEVRDAMTACNIKDLRPGNKIQVNDTVNLI